MKDKFNLQNKYWLERIESEIKFALNFSDLYPRHKREWVPLINNARKRIEKALELNRPDLFPAAVEEAEKMMAPISKFAKKHVIHCVGHAHIDMNWIWGWPETASITIDTFITVLKLMEKYENFCFSQSQASTYRIVEKYRPDLLEKANLNDEDMKLLEAIRAEQQKCEEDSSERN